MPKRESIKTAGFPRLQRVATGPESVDSLVDDLVMAIAGPSLSADRPEVDQFQRRISELQGQSAPVAPVSSGGDGAAFAPAAAPVEPERAATALRTPHPIEERMRRLDRALRNLDPEPVSPEPEPEPEPAVAMEPVPVARPVVRPAQRPRPADPVAVVDLDEPWFDEPLADGRHDRRFVRRMLFAAALATLAFLSIPIMARFATAQTQSESVVAESTDTPDGATGAAEKD
jgi:hypothetical protein